MGPWILAGCSAPPESAGIADALPSAEAYTTGCEAQLAPFPALSCDDVPEVVQEVTLARGGTRVVRGAEDLGPGGTCDRPSLLSACTPGSRAGVVRVDGIDWYLLCRVERFDTPPGEYDDVALIARDEATGATCMWGAPPDGRRREGTTLPRPGATDADGFWADVPDLAAIGCRSCHDGNAVVVTPWIADALPPRDADAGMHLVWADELATVDASWLGTPLWTHPDAAPCRTCHELPQGPVCTFGPDAIGRDPDPLRSPALSSWPADRWMDAYDPATLASRHGTESGWESQFGPAADRLVACCSAPDDGDCWSR